MFPPEALSLRDHRSGDTGSTPRPPELVGMPTDGGSASRPPFHTASRGQRTKGTTMSEHPLRPTRRAVLAGTLGALGALAAASPLARAADQLPPIGDTAPTDWSRAVIDSTMKRYTPDKIGGWGYTLGLYLY